MIALALLRLVTLVFFVRLAVRFAANVLVGMREEPAADLVRDRVCNTFVRRDRAVRAMVGGREEHFCSPACRDRARVLLEAP
jgi:hypothetical protein